MAFFKMRGRLFWPNFATAGGGGIISFRIVLNEGKCVCDICAK